MPSQFRAECHSPHILWLHLSAVLKNPRNLIALTPRPPCLPLSCFESMSVSKTAEGFIDWAHSGLSQVLKVSGSSSLYLSKLHILNWDKHYNHACIITDCLYYKFTWPEKAHEANAETPSTCFLFCNGLILQKNRSQTEANFLVMTSQMVSCLSESFLMSLWVFFSNEFYANHTPEDM